MYLLSVTRFQGTYLDTKDDSYGICVGLIFILL